VLTKSGSAVRRLWRRFLQVKKCRCYCEEIVKKCRFWFIDCPTRKMAEIKVIEQVFEKLSEILTVDQLEKIAQLFLAKSSEIVSNTRKSNETSTILGNFVNLVLVRAIGY
jgi:hypothetical protein